MENKITNLNTPIELKKETIKKIENKAKIGYALSYVILFILIGIYGLLLSNIDSIEKIQFIIKNSLFAYLMIGIGFMFYGIFYGRDMRFFPNVFGFSIKILNHFLYKLGGKINIYKKEYQPKKELIIKLNLKQYFYKNKKLHNERLPAIIHSKRNCHVSGDLYYSGDYYINGKPVDGYNIDWNEIIKKLDKQEKIEKF